MAETSRKKTLGRRKIKMQKIDNKSSLQVTFSKRRKGLFTKACSLCVDYGAEIAILVQSPAGKVFTFGNPSVEAVVGRFQKGEPENVAVGYDSWKIRVCESSRIEYEEAVRRLEMEKEVERRMEKNVREFWWEKGIEGMELYQLEEFLDAMEGLRGNVLRRLEKMKLDGTASLQCLGALDGCQADDDLRAIAEGVGTGFCDQEFEGLPSMHNEDMTTSENPKVDDCLKAMVEYNDSGFLVSSDNHPVDGEFPYWECPLFKHSSGHF